MNIFSLIYKINWLFIFILILITSIGVALLYSIAGGEWQPWALKQIILLYNLYHKDPDEARNFYL